MNEDFVKWFENKQIYDAIQWGFYGIIALFSGKFLLRCC
jgi:hypothetical protein